MFECGVVMFDDCFVECWFVWVVCVYGCVCGVKNEWMCGCVWCVLDIWLWVYEGVV